MLLLSDLTDVTWIAGVVTLHLDSGAVRKNRPIESSGISSD